MTLTGSAPDVRPQLLLVPTAATESPVDLRRRVVRGLLQDEPRACSLEPQVYLFFCVFLWLVTWNKILVPCRRTMYSLMLQTTHDKISATLARRVVLLESRCPGLLHCRNCNSFGTLWCSRHLVCSLVIAILKQSPRVCRSNRISIVHSK